MKASSKVSSGTSKPGCFHKPTLPQKEEWRVSVFLVPFIYSASTHLVPATSRDKARMLLPSWEWHPLLPSGSYIQGNQRHGGEETDPGNFQLIHHHEAGGSPVLPDQPGGPHAVAHVPSYSFAFPSCPPAFPTLSCTWF